MSGRGTPSLTCLCYDDITVHSLVDLGFPLDSHQAVLLGVVDPVTCPSSPDEALQLVGLDPHWWHGGERGREVRG